SPARKYPNPNHQPAAAAETKPPQRPAAAPSMSQTRIGNVRNGAGHTESGGSARVVKAPAANAIRMRRHPHASMTEWARRAGFTAGAKPSRAASRAGAVRPDRD